MFFFFQCYVFPFKLFILCLFPYPLLFSANASHHFLFFDLPLLFYSFFLHFLYHFNPFLFPLPFHSFPLLLLSPPAHSLFPLPSRQSIFLSIFFPILYLIFFLFPSRQTSSSSLQFPRLSISVSPSYLSSSLIFPLPSSAASLPPSPLPSGPLVLASHSLL